MAQATEEHTKRRQNEEISERHERESKEKRDRDRDHFSALWSEWLKLRSEEDNIAIDVTDEEANARAERLKEIARILCATPAPLSWQVMQKIEVLEFYLGCEGGTSWTDNREIAMLAGIKADLLRFNIGEDGEGA